LLIRKLDVLCRGLLYEVMGGINEFRRVLKLVLQNAINDVLSVRHVDEFSCIGRRDIPQFSERRTAWLISNQNLAKILGIEIAISKKGDPFHRYPLLDLLEFRQYDINRARLERIADELWSKARGVTKFDIVGYNVHSRELYFIEVKNLREIGASNMDLVDENALKRAITRRNTLKTQFSRQQEFVNSIKKDLTAWLLYAVIDVDKEYTQVKLYQASEKGIKFSPIEKITLKNEKLRVKKYTNIDAFFSAIKEGSIPLCQAMRSIVYLIRMKLL